MANVRDSDTSLWLHNKLGASNDLWSDTCSIISQLNTDVLRSIRDCFDNLQSQVKLKLLLSILHISRRSVEEWKQELEDIIEVAVADTDQWVSVLAELLKPYPSKGIINFNIDVNSSNFTDLISELKKLVKKYGDRGILPMECLYLNKSALTAAVGSMPAPPKHFTLKRKPKSAALRAELLQKSNDAASGKRSAAGSSVPIRCRGLTNDSTPLRGIPSRNLFGLSQSGFKTPTNPINKSTLNRSISRSGGGIKRDGGIKLLDINEQPMGRDAKRRKKLTEDAEAKQKENEKTEETSTPDYAAGLTSMIPPSPAPPSYAPPSTPAPQSIVISDAGQSQQTQPQKIVVNIDLQVKNESTVQQPKQLQQPQQQQPQQHKQPQLLPQPPNKPEAQIQVVNINTQQVQSQIHTPVQVQLRPQVQTQQQQQQQPMIKRQLQLSREQMLEAQEMFKNSNKVTRPEKALILGFMAGSRENPCPQLGNIVTIKLSEHENQLQQEDGTIQNVVVETHFQMNYNTGEWKRVQKYRKADQMMSINTIQPIQGFSQQQTV